MKGLSSGSAVSEAWNFMVRHVRRGSCRWWFGGSGGSVGGLADREFGRSGEAGELHANGELGEVAGSGEVL